MAAALLIKGKPAGDSDSLLLTYRTADKAETEKKLQQLAKQCKQEKDWVQAHHAQLLQELGGLRERIEQLERSGSRAQQAEPGNLLADSAAAAPAVEGPQDKDLLALRERYRRAFELQQEGLGPDEIAKRLGAGRGEIDLIFALATRKERGMADA